MGNLAGQDGWGFNTPSQQSQECLGLRGGYEQVVGLFTAVMSGCEVLGKVVTLIVLAGFPVDFELALFGSIAYPVESHVHCTRSLLFD
jgi:hypothetical protein